MPICLVGFRRILWTRIQFIQNIWLNLNLGSYLTHSLFSVSGQLRCALYTNHVTLIRVYMDACKCIAI